jgi:predicted MFS family arabinose efflux permease
MVHSTGDAPGSADEGTLDAFGLALEGVTEATWDTEADGSIHSGTLIEGSFGQPVGGVVVVYPADELRSQARSMAEDLIAIGMAVGAVLIALAVAVLTVVGRRRGDASTVNPEDEFDHALSTPRGVGVALSFVPIIGVVVFGVLTVPVFTSALAPELERRAALIGETISDDTERAIGIGIPITELVGVGEYFSEYLDRFAEINYLAIRSSDDTRLYESDRISNSGERLGADSSDIYEFAINGEFTEEGSVDVGVDSGFVESRLRELAFDVIVILIVALVIVFEIFRVAGRRMWFSADDGTDEAAGLVRGAADIRIVLFLFVIGEELNKSFLPLFIESAGNPIPGISTAVAISLPIAAYLLAIAVASPFATRLIVAFGQRGLFLIGVVPAALSHLGMVFADNVVQIILLRTMTGVGYALATIACLEYILDRISASGRAKGISAFVAVVIGGTFVGTALGGIIADRLGYSTVFFISFSLVILAGLLALRLMPRKSTTDGERTALFSIRDMRLVLKQPSLMLLMAGVTVPMNVLMAAFLWYLVPLTMASIGLTAATIARTLMLYYLVILLGSPVIARVANRGFKNWILVGFGSVIAGAVLLLPAWSPSLLSLSLAVFVVGVGHTAVRGPQIDLALQIAEDELPGVGRDPVLSAMRSLERLGSLVGLLLVAVLAAQYDLTFAIAAIGVTSAATGIAYLALRRSASRSWIDA